MSHKKYCICFVVPEAYGIFSERHEGPIGGAEIQQMLMAKALTKAGHDVNVIVKDEIFYEPYKWCGVKVYPCKFRYLLGSNLYFVPDTIKLIKLLKTINADFNLMKTPNSILFAMGMYRKLFGGKLIKLIAHDSDCSRLGNGLVSYLYPFGTKFLDYTIFQSEYQLIEGRKGLGLKGCVVKNIAHGKIESVSDNKDIDALWVGSCSKRKQPNIFLELAKALPEYNFNMILSATVGNKFYENEILSGLKSIANIENLGQTEYRKMSDIYSRAKVLVSTSTPYGEGFPNTFLQAWQFGVPVVSLNINPDNIITDNEIGFVSGSFEQMVEDVKLLLSDDLLREKLGNNAVRYMDSNHSEEVIVKRLNEIFEALATKGN